MGRARYQLLADTLEEGIDMKALQGIEVLDREGRAVSLDGIWSDQPVVLVFVRHFG